MLPFHYLLSDFHQILQEDANNDVLGNKSLLGGKTKSNMAASAILDFVSKCLYLS
jgi:hypothetical protein